MKLLVVEKVNGSPKIPLTPSFLLAQNVMYSLIGYSGFKHDVTILREGDGIMPASEAYKVEKYTLAEYESKIRELSVNKYDGVIVFDADLVLRSKNLPISNLIYCCSESGSFLTEEFKEVLREPWIKVLAFMPSLKDIQGLKISKFCSPECYYESDNEPKLISHSQHTIIFPVDVRMLSSLDAILFDVMNRCKVSYPNSKLIVGFIGVEVREFGQRPENVEFKGYHTLAEYVKDLFASDLQVSYRMPYELDLYPFLSLQYGIPVALVSGPDFSKDYPYLDEVYTEILGINSTEMEAQRLSDPGYSQYLKNQARAHDEIQFNIKFQSALASVINVDYREEYRTPFADKMEELKEFHKTRVESAKSEAKDDKTDNELQESERGTEALQENKSV